MTRPTREAVAAVFEALSNEEYRGNHEWYQAIGECRDVVLALFPEGRSEQDQGGETERTLAEYRKSLDLTEAACRSLDAELSAVRLRIKALETLMAALEGFDDDYMTSEAHHPEYVLIPVAKFEAIRAALLSSAQGETKDNNWDDERALGYRLPELPCGSRDEPTGDATAALAVDYTSPTAPSGWYVIYTDADGRRELAHDACFRENQANAAQKARIMGPGFSPLYWNGKVWMPPAAAPDAAALVEGEKQP